MNTDTTRQFAVVTGASSGIGLELAKQFAKNGFDLLIAAESNAINTAAEEIQALGAQVEPVQTDLAVTTASKNSIRRFAPLAVPWMRLLSTPALVSAVNSPIRISMPN